MLGEKVMELTWEWRGYSIGIKMAKERQIRRQACSSATQTTEGQGTNHYEDDAWRDHTMSSGSRNVGPIR
jgi:hypothetical protein